ncbi:hypothetical protein [Streptomyces anthocyanicus]|uniref:hypothetical protein n=1 Tax=Streptomyces anthocyanicus TaxID=68174 RepID=UPI0022433EF0|nr:hypothetical protein [Streptomyces anthocyanicus]MCW8121862.1 hypothetical protein [Streptomyces anthocyanicus]
MSAIPREFLCEHASSKSRVLVLLAHPDGPACVQAVFTCRDARAAQQAARLLSSAALNGTLTEQQETTAHKIATQLPDAPAASFRQALERARAGVWPSTAPASFSWPADDPLEEPAQDEPDLPVSAARSPKDARLADLPGPVVRVVQLREFHVYDQAKVLAAAAACGWVPVPEEELGEDDPYDVVGAVMFAAETTGELPGMDWLTDAQEGQLLLPGRGDEVADWSAEPVRINFGTGWRLRQAANPYATAPRPGTTPPVSEELLPDFASLFALPEACGCEEEDCQKCRWTFTPRTADLLFSALDELAEAAYDEAAELGERPVTKDDDGVWGFFARLPQVTWRQSMQWRRDLARACDDLSGDLRHGKWPRPSCAAEEMVLHFALDEAPTHLVADDSAHAALPQHRDDYDFDACSEFFFQDHDVLWLYDGTYNEDSPGADGPGPSGIPAALHPDNWFENFLSVPARSPGRPHRR